MASKADEKGRLGGADTQGVREIIRKAVSAIFVGMLKWFPVSHNFWLSSRVWNYELLRDFLTNVFKFE